MTTFLERQLNHFDDVLVEESYPERKMVSGELISIKSNVPDAAETYSYGIMTQVGTAKLLTNGAADIPSVEVLVEERYARIYSVANKFSFTERDLERARLANMNLEGRLALVAQEVIYQTLDNIAYDGHPNSQIIGFLNQPNALTYTLPADGNENGGVNSTQFQHKTAEQIYRDLVNMVSAIRIDSRGVEVADTILMPIEQFEIINSLPFPNNSAATKTVLEFFLDTQARSGGISKVIPCDYLAGKGVGGTDLMIVYKNSPNKQELIIPTLLRRHKEEYRDMKYFVPLEARIAGCVFYKPASLRYASGC
jgi:hypothetical protein